LENLRPEDLSRDEYFISLSRRFGNVFKASDRRGSHPQDPFENDGPPQGNHSREEGISEAKDPLNEVKRSAV
jgi:hypothetical protein